MVTVNATTSHLAGQWPLFGPLTGTPRLQLRLPREDELSALAQAARDIASPDGPRLQMPWMYGGSPDMERKLLQRHWRALAHWKPASWHLPLAVFLAAEPVGMQDLWAEELGQGVRCGLSPTWGAPCAHPSVVMSKLVGVGGGCHASDGVILEA
jgi:hypothetical protein